MNRFIEVECCLALCTGDGRRTQDTGDGTKETGDGRQKTETGVEKRMTENTEQREQRDGCERTDVSRKEKQEEGRQGSRHQNEDAARLFILLLVKPST